MSVKNQNTNGKQTVLGTFNGSLGGLDLYSNGVTARQWDAWVNSVPFSSIEQTWSYGEAFVGVTPYTPVHSVVYKKKLPVASNYFLLITQGRLGNLVIKKYTNQFQKMNGNPILLQKRQKK